MDANVKQEIESLRNAKASVLKARYRELFGEESPSFNRAHLFRRVAWRLQARSLGELSERARQRAAELADDADLRQRAPRGFWRALEERNQQGPQRDPRLPEPGTVLSRTYQQRSIEVKVLESGFEYEGRIFSSLSAVAHKITGTRWNGFLFFHLKERRRG